VQARDFGEKKREEELGANTEQDLTNRDGPVAHLKGWYSSELAG
jgi:hypothetical protein